MSIWFSRYSLEQVQLQGKGTMVEHLGITISEMGDTYLRGTMPVDQRTLQPMGILHGGASLALAETLGSMAANLVVDPQKNFCVGLDINGNHLKAVRAGNTVTGTASPLHIGSTTQVWSIEMKNEEGNLICICRLTMAVLQHNNK